MIFKYKQQVTSDTPWNYAIHLSNIDNDLTFEKVGLKEGLAPFSIEGAPSKITATV